MVSPASPLPVSALSLASKPLQRFTGRAQGFCCELSSSNWETIPTCTGDPHCCCCPFPALRLTEQHPSSRDAGRSLREACGGACHRVGPWGSTGAVSHAVYAGVAGGSGNTR